MFDGDLNIHFDQTFILLGSCINLPDIRQTLKSVEFMNLSLRELLVCTEIRP